MGPLLPKLACVVLGVVGGFASQQWVRGPRSVVALENCGPTTPGSRPKAIDGIDLSVMGQKPDVKMIHLRAGQGQMPQEQVAECVYQINLWLLREDHPELLGNFWARCQGVSESGKPKDISSMCCIMRAANEDKRFSRVLQTPSQGIGNPVEPCKGPCKSSDPLSERCTSGQSD